MGEWGGGEREGGKERGREGGRQGGIRRMTECVLVLTFNKIKVDEGRRSEDI